jgi:hypothetical protein
MQKRSTSVLVYCTVGCASTISQCPQHQPQATASSDCTPVAGSMR